MANTADKPRSYASLWALILVFALPPMLAWFFFLNPQWLPADHSNHGSLIDPPRNLESLMLQSASGAHFDWQSLRDHWTLVQVSQGGCDAACIEGLIKMRQIRLASGAERERIARLLVLQSGSRGSEPPNLDGLEGTRIAIADKDQRESLLSLFPVDFDEQVISLFIIDPQLNLMMSYDTSQIGSKQILQDLQKLLKASQGWAKGGQYGHQ